MRKLIAIASIALLVFPFMGTLSILQLQKHLVRKDVKHRIMAGIDRSELVYLSFSENEKTSLLNWKHSKEFAYRGEMYDIVFTEVKGDTTAYWCWWDREETVLNQKLAALTMKALGENSHKAIHLAGWLNHFKLSPPGTGLSPNEAGASLLNSPVIASIGKVKPPHSGMLTAPPEREAA